MAEVTHPLPVEAKDAESVRNLERYVGVPVRPSSFERAGAHLVGARILPLHAQRGAMLQYVVGTGADERRVSVLVYDAEKIQNRRREPGAPSGRHRRGARRELEGLLGGGGSARRSGLHRRGRPRP